MSVCLYAILITHYLFKFRELIPALTNIYIGDGKAIEASR